MAGPSESHGPKPIYPPQALVRSHQGSIHDINSILDYNSLHDPLESTYTTPPNGLNRGATPTSHLASRGASPTSVPDPALLLANEHHHAHLHHDVIAEGTQQDEAIYTNDTTFERQNIPDAEPSEQHRSRLHHRHAVAGPISTTPPSHRDETASVIEMDSPDEETEKGHMTPTVLSTTAFPDPQSHRLSNLYTRYCLVIHAVIWLLATAWWVTGLILHRHDLGWLIPLLLYFALTLRLFFFHVPISIITKPMRSIWEQTAVRATSHIPARARLPCAASVVIAVILVGAFLSPESLDNTRVNRAVSLFGLVVFIAVLYATSANRRHIQWHTVIVGMLVQFLVALFVLRTRAGFDIFNFISRLARSLLSFAAQGTAFLTSPTVAATPWFLLGVLPAIIFFVALVQLLYYCGLLQWFILKFAHFFFWSMRVSGAEAVVAAASPFIGQGESAMLIRPFVAHLTRAELHQVMTSGFATIAGSVLVAYIGLGVNPQALISSCVMSIPASLAISKLRYPETEETLTAGRVVIPDDDEHRAVNALHAFANGAWLGLRIAGMILATLLCILALLGLTNGLLAYFGHYLNINDPPLSVQLIVGYLCYPIAFLLGVPRNADLFKVSQLIGTKLVANEFVAYTALQQDPLYADLSPRSRLIATYALCGFANIGSLGTQIGVLSQIAPGRSGDVSRLAVSALLAGAISTLTSASVAGLLVTDQAQFFTPGKVGGG